MKTTYIIAEAGVNHNGDIELGKRMIEVAAKANVSSIKFQTFKPEMMTSKFAVKAEYQKINLSDEDDSQLAMLKKYELTEKMHLELMKCCSDFGVDFLSTPFDIDSIELLKQLGIGKWKIPSGEITNLPYLRRIAQSDKPIILSTGMSTLEEVGEAVAVLKTSEDREITLLHCNTQYPTPYQDVNLKAMQTLKDTFHLPVGYSDHTKGIEISLAAVVMGASVVEKHFTLDRNMPGPDHKASLTPTELDDLVIGVRNIEAAMGDGVKIPSVSETPNISIARKSIVAERSIRSGEVFSEQNITVKRPGDGLSPMLWDDIIGEIANRDYFADEKIVL
jgi:N,N'-diacetyllegionaminate synthase